MADIEVLGVYREKTFSPGKISQDAAILDATLALLPEAAYRVNTFQIIFCLSQIFRTIHIDGL